MVFFSRAVYGSLELKTKSKVDQTEQKSQFHSNFIYKGKNLLCDSVDMSMSQITPTLFLSGADASLNQALLSRKGITLIVNATLSHSCPRYPGVECIRVAVSDLPSARLSEHFDRVASRIHSNQAGGTLVHCAAGMSRSPALIMAYLMKYKGVTLQQAHSWVQRSRPYIRLNAGFWQQLLDYERGLYGKETP
uniref:Si:ch1073-184j22.2 n=1 Tax=Astyanax mexicanus TaxID=7994 RepID=W5LS25_ASTMX